MNDFDRVARVIEFLNERHTEQPDLEMLAGQVGLSVSHFHRMFSRWAGITPKDFLQCLTLHHARSLLREGESLLNSSLETGLSGPGRLHDLCVTLEAASPGEIKSGGAGCVIHFGFASTPFGNWLTAETARGICHLEFTESDENLRAVWPRAALSRDDSAAESLTRRIFQNAAPQSPLRAFVRGTEFQVRVWRALLQLPPGSVTSYGRLANFVGNPKASRAVGSAVGQNPIAYLIPCHRVIRETGVINGYRWGDTRKRALLAWESKFRKIEA